MNDLKPLQGLRGICSLAIFLGHQTDIFVTSSIGIEYLQAVSLFFLLSGIPLWRLYGPRSGKDLGTYKDKRIFWIKRVARLAPMYYLSLIANLLTIVLLAKEVEWRPLIESFFGCFFLLQSFFVSLINVGGVLWQIAMFVYGYVAFPYVSMWTSHLCIKDLIIGFLCLWLFPLAKWVYIFTLDKDAQEWSMWIWHVSFTSRFPQLIAGIIVGQVVEKLQMTGQRANLSNLHHHYTLLWCRGTDIISFVLFLTAMQAPIVQYYYSTQVRTEISIGLQAVLLPLHALWLAGIVLSHDPEQNHICWTRCVLSNKLLEYFGNISLVLYCLHIEILFTYNAIYSFYMKGSFGIMETSNDLEPNVLVPMWHMVIQWLVVILISHLVSNYIESPLRKMISNAVMKRYHDEEENTSNHVVNESSALLVEKKPTVITSC